VYCAYVTVTGIVCEPPVSLPYTVIVVLTVDVNDGFGINLNDNPLATAAVADTSSPMKIGTVPISADTPSPIMSPAFLFERIIVYPQVLLPAGDVVGDRETSPLL
jgi:hypothetical protein